MTWNEHISRLWRRAKFNWLNAKLLTDVAIASVLFFAGFWISLALPTEKRQFDAAAGIPQVFISLVPLFLMSWHFWNSRQYLKAEAAFEDLRTNKPAKPGLFKTMSYPFSAVVVYALLVGIALGTLRVGGWGPAIRTSLNQVTTPLAPIAFIVNAVELQLHVSTDDPWPSWIMFLLSFFYSTVVFALVAAWFERGKQRQNFVTSLFTEEPRAGTAFGKYSERGGVVQPEPHEQVLLMRGDRIAAASLPYLQVELSGPEWTSSKVDPNLCRGAVAVLERIFTQRLENGEVVLAKPDTCWKLQPGASDWIADWLLGHLARLVTDDRLLPDPSFDHRLGEAIQAVAAVLASGQFHPVRPNLASREEKFRGLLRELFSRSPRRPVLLLSACTAAERLGQPADLELLDEQTKHLDVQSGFTVAHTDLILGARDRVLAREPLRSKLLDQLLCRIKELGLEPVPALDERQLLFRRLSDNGMMVLIVSGSFVRGDDHCEDTAPKRRVHVNSYLLDVEPVSQESFQGWLKQHGGVLRVERGFFPVQGIPDGAATEQGYASHVTWFAAQAYAQWAVTGGHLPTEAQWEKAARGVKDERRYPSGEAWADNSFSPFGIRACHLLEWAKDEFNRLAYRYNPSIFDPCMEAAGSAVDEAMRVVRGRSPKTSVANYSVVNRLAMEPVTGAFTAPVGFRVAVDLEGESEA